jgi:tripartite-type tricarboxylate transporter receptor subunit TctC
MRFGDGCCIRLLPDQAWLVVEHALEIEMNLKEPLRLVAVALALVTAIAVHAADPSVTRIVVGFAPGGGADGVARVYARAMSAALGREVIVDNKVGAGGILAAQAVKAAPADGSTVLMGAIVINVLAPVTMGKIGFDPEADFIPVAQLSRLDSGLAVGAASPYKTVKDYLAAAKADPLKASFGSPAPGSLAHFFGLVLGDAAGVQLQHVAYKGSSPMALDLIGGRLPAGIAGASDFVQMHKEGRLRLLGTSGEHRSPYTPDVPTFKEAGYPTAVGSSWTGLFAPAGTPTEQVQKIAHAAAEATKDPAVRKALEAIGMELPNVDSAGFAKQVAQDRRRWIPVVKASGFTAEK